MDDARILEKLGNHRYRLTLKWDGTEKNYEYLQRNNFKYLEGNIYFVEFEMESELFNYGVSMSECYLTLFQNGHFSDDFIRFSLLQPVNAKMMKQAEGSVPISNFIETLINMTGVDNFMYFIAKNYDSALAKEAERQYGDMDKDSFLGWLIETITPRFSGNVTRETFASYFIADDWKQEASNINWPYSFFSAWEFVADHKEEYSAWRETVSDQDGIDINVVSSLLNNVYSEYTHYFQFYFFTEDLSARRLFQMRNSSSVDYNTKKLIQDVLVDYCKDDSEFAETLQRFYSEYKSIAGGGVGIDFVPSVFENDSFNFPIDDVKYHLDKDIVDEDQSGFIGEIINERNDTDNLAKIFSYLVEFHYVTPKELDTTIYRFTGKRKPQGDSLLETVVWKGKPNDALYICKEFYNGKYDKMLRFFDVKVEGIAQKNYSSYADRPSKGIRDFFNGVFLVKPK